MTMFHDVILCKHIEASRGQIAISRFTAGITADELYDVIDEYRTLSTKISEDPACSLLDIYELLRHVYNAMSAAMNDPRYSDDMISMMLYCMVDIMNTTARKRKSDLTTSEAVFIKFETQMSENLDTFQDWAYYIGRNIEQAESSDDEDYEDYESDQDMGLPVKK